MCNTSMYRGTRIEVIQMRVYLYITKWREGGEEWSSVTEFAIERRERLNDDPSTEMKLERSLSYSHLLRLDFYQSSERSRGEKPEFL